MKKITIAVTVIFLAMGTMLFGNGQEENIDPVLTNVEFPLETPITLNVLTSVEAGSDQTPKEKTIYQRIYEDTNVNIDWTSYVKDQFIEKRNLTLATGYNLPDIILNAEMGTLDLLRYAKQEVIIPVEDLIDNYMPNLKAVLEEAPSYRALITAPDGHIYGFPWIEQLGVGKTAIQAIGGMPFINKKWLDDLGLKVPETTQELEDVLLAFKEYDPAGDGQTIPLTFIINGGNEDLGFILGAFGYGDNPDHIMVDNDGKVVYSLTQDGYKKGIKWLNSLQEKGLIDLEAFTQDWPTIVAKGQNGRYGMFFGWDNYGIPGTYWEDYIPLPALKGPEGVINAVRGSGSADGGFQAGRAVITADCVNLEVAAKWIDKMYEPIQSIQNNWGTYGESGVKNNIFELKPNGTLSHLEIKDQSNWEARVHQMVGGPLAILNSYYGKYTTCPPDALERMGYVESYVKNMKYNHVYPNVFMSQEDATLMYQYETELKGYAEQKKAEWILQGGIDQEWNEYLEKLEALGLTKFLALKQKYLNDYLGK